MTQAELIAALPEGRLPPALMHLQASDAVALFGAGLCLAALLCWLATPFFDRRPSRRARIRATRALSPQERALTLARIIGHLPEELRGTAYGTGHPLDAEAMERIALKARPARR